MAEWKTRSEGGSWLGGGTEVTACNETEQTAILAAFDTVVALPGLDFFPGLRGLVQEAWDDSKIDCRNPDRCTVEANVGSVVGEAYDGDTLLFCDPAPNRYAPIMLHELVHLCDGGELDAEAIENYCFDWPDATPPFNDDDWDKFRSETSRLNGNRKERVGEFVIWNSDTGEVWVRGESGGAPAKGALCFKRDEWIHDYS